MYKNIIDEFFQTPPCSSSVFSPFFTETSSVKLVPNAVYYVACCCTVCGDVYAYALRHILAPVSVDECRSYIYR